MCSENEGEENAGRMKRNFEKRGWRKEQTAVETETKNPQREKSKITEVFLFSASHKLKQMKNTKVQIV